MKTYLNSCTAPVAAIVAMLFLAFALSGCGGDSGEDLVPIRKGATTQSAFSGGGDVFNVPEYDSKKKVMVSVDNITASRAHAAFVNLEEVLGKHGKVLVVDSVPGKLIYSVLTTGGFKIPLAKVKNVAGLARMTVRGESGVIYKAEWTKDSPERIAVSSGEDVAG